MKVVFFSFRTLLRLMVLALFCLPGFAVQVEAGENVVSTIQNSGTKSTLLGTFFRERATRLGRWGRGNSLEN